VSLTNAEVPLFVRKRLIDHERNDITTVDYNATAANNHKRAAM
jgi:hypothetical protein